MPDPLRRRLRGRALGIGGAIARRAPGPLVRGVLSCAARIAGTGPWGERARSNLELAYGRELSPAERGRIARGVFRHAAHQAETWLRLSRGAPPAGSGSRSGAWIEDLVEIDPSIEVLERELAHGRGAIVLTAHLGDWELLCAALRRRGHSGAVVGRLKHRDPLAARWIALRRGYGVETIPQDASPRRLLEVLARGEIVGMLCDLEVRRLDGEFVPFFGRPALTMTGPAALARAHAAPLVPARCVRGATGRYRLSVDEPLAYESGADRRTATFALLERMNATYERWIRETPEQWAWHQDRWRTPPGVGEPAPSWRRRGEESHGR